MAEHLSGLGDCSKVNFVWSHPYFESQWQINSQGIRVMRSIKRRIDQINNLRIKIFIHKNEHLFVEWGSYLAS